MEYWTIDDINAGLCDVDDLGRPKPQVPDPDVETTAEYKTVKDALEQALRQVGGVGFVRDFARQYPRQFMQVLSKLLPIEVRTESDITFHIQHALPPPNYAAYDRNNVGPQKGIVIEYIPSERDVMSYLRKLTNEQRADLIIKAAIGDEVVEIVEA